MVVRVMSRSSRARWSSAFGRTREASTLGRALGSGGFGESGSPRVSGVVGGRAARPPAVARGTLATVAVAVLVAATLIATGTSSGATDAGRGGGPGAAARPVLPAVTAPDPAAADGARGEADVSYHGHVSLWNGHVGVWLATANHGPSPVSGATVRLRFSLAFDPGATLPPSCLRTGPSAVQCGTGPMRAAGNGVQLALDLATLGTPTEVGLDIDTVWNGGMTDHNPANNTHHVLAPATGDPYTF
ncbi:hypothetical protein ACFYZ9_32235 [Streptomyces sp. NPDC001691]|uniref:hypothetical protein n=1 Tax=Streptomyces sp. NPDC001691 TaxID=3364600 RepID=UPI00368121F1